MNNIYVLVNASHLFGCGLITLSILDDMRVDNYNVCLLLKFVN